MAGEWKETTLGDCAAWLSGGTPFKGNSAFWSGSIPWVSAKDMKSFRLHDAEDHISPLAVGSGGKLVPAGTILLLVRGMTLHNDVPICMVTREMAFNQDIKALRPAKNVDGAFLAYWLLANKPDLLASVDHAGHGTGRLVTDTLKEKLVQLPPLAEQKSIAAILGALDDKIELNRRMNATLEAMARALFQSWFVDFDPVRAKLDGRLPTGLDPATATLFPDSFQDSALGPIPIGWRTAHLLEIASVGSGKRPEGRCDVLSPECSIPLYGGGGRMGYVPSALYDKPILFTGRVGTLGLIFRTAEPSWPSDNTLIVEPQAGFFDFTYFVLKGFDLITLNRGSTQPLLTQTDLKGQTFVLPVKDVVNAFADVTEPIFRQMVSNERESHTLATLRDTLLPKLLSGELSVEGAAN